MAKKRKPLDKLTIISIAAQKEGLSYGKYMAKYGYHPPCLNNLPEEIIPPEPKTAIPEYLKDMEKDFQDQGEKLKKCKVCGGLYEPIRGNQRYCSKACNEVARKERERKKVLEGKVQRYCEICGKPLPLEMSAARLTCSKECCAEHKRRYDRKKNKQYREAQKEAREKGE